MAVEIDLADAKDALQKSRANYDELAPAITQKNAANRRLARQTRSRKLPM
ncbi:hypothetical protein [Bradyrhizobium diazoefficiens]|nr:hypothetical protein [Bradyrhizobium diazoefficiens]WLA66478.1 hypothetical protein QNN01_06695 [Bradyrhizobium diazoefficiens]